MRVLFTTTPGRGHFHPMVPLAAALRERGHEVAWAAAEHVCARLRTEGFVAIAAGLDEDVAMERFEQQFSEYRELAPADRPDFFFPRLFGPMRAQPMLDDLLPIARAFEPALVVSEQAEFAGPLVAARLGVANVAHAFGSMLPAARVACAADYLAGMWEAQGLEPRPYAGAYDHLYVDIYPPSMQAADMSHIAAVQPIRPVTFAAGGDEQAPAWVRDGDGDPLVYVTFGTVFNRDVSMIATVVGALADLPLRVVVTLGPGRDPALLGAQPPNVHVAGYIAQTQLLDRVAAVVSHAGSGTFLAALARGLPQLLLPQAADQFLNAAAGARAGVGIAIAPSELTAERVRDAIQRLLADRAFAEAARRMSHEIEAMPSPAAVAGELELRFGAVAD
jgi:UDP:flavonoid glycosyltransferase YjiC (YdhE family)